jgi:imidazolonepropionase-like amidohydrolase
MVHAGADWIKIATTGGVSTPVGGPLTRQFSREEVAAIVDVAHAAGKPVMCHAYGGEGAKIAIDCGVQSIEHGAALDRSEMELMVEKGIWLVPTFSVLVQVAEIASRSGSTLPPYVLNKARDLLDTQRKTFAEAMEIGVKIALGTDIGGLCHGHNAREFEYMVDAGMPALRAIVAGTSDAAQCIGLGGEVGFLAEGKIADLLLISGNPLVNIGILDKRDHIRLIMKSGDIIKQLAS